MRRQTAFQAFIGIFFCVSALVWTERATANSAPPPAVVWFYIQDEAGDAADVDGVQLWGCTDEACEQPSLLQAWGACSAPDCLPGTARLTAAVGNILHSLECGPADGETRCRSAAFRYAQPYFRLALARGDRLWIQAKPLPLPQGYGETDYYQVGMLEEGLTIDPASARPTAKLPVPPFLAFFGISLVIELAVLGIYSVLRWKLDATGTVKRLLLAALINLLTYPVVWGFFPSLQRWSGAGSRSAMWPLAAFMLLISGMLWGVFNASTKRRRWAWIGLMGLIVLAGLFCLMLSTFASMYGYPQVTASGFPAEAVLLLAEAYAVLVEGLLLCGFTRRQVPLREALALSLGMNMASFLAGLLLAW